MFCFGKVNGIKSYKFKTITYLVNSLICLQQCKHWIFFFFQSHSLQFANRIILLFPFVFQICSTISLDCYIYRIFLLLSNNSVLPFKNVLVCILKFTWSCLHFLRLFQVYDPIVFVKPNVLHKFQFQIFAVLIMA